MFNEISDSCYFHSFFRPWFSILGVYLTDNAKTAISFVLLNVFTGMLQTVENALNVPPASLRAFTWNLMETNFFNAMLSNCETAKFCMELVFLRVSGPFHHISLKVEFPLIKAPKRRRFYDFSKN